MSHAISKISIIIRADAGGSLGAGHVLRMVALAQALLECGFAPCIAMTTCPEGILKRLSDESITHSHIKAQEPGDSEDIKETIALAQKAQSRWIILDGYHFDKNYQRELHKKGFKIAVIDDYGHCDKWCADLIINQNIGTEGFIYQNEIENHTALTGVAYVLLRKEFRRADQLEVKRPQNSLLRILITMGGVDQDNTTGIILSAISRTRIQPLNIKVLIGGGNPHGAELRKQAAQSEHEISFIEDARDMPSLYRWANGVISAGGSTCYEWLLFKCEAAILTLADNQRSIANYLTSRGLAHSLGDIEQLNANQCTDLLEPWIESLPFTRLAKKNLKIDAFGVYRIIAQLQSNPIWMREVLPEDVSPLFKLANDPDVRRNAINVDLIPWQTHTAWFDEKRSSSKTFFLVAFDSNDKFTGQIRFDQCSHSKNTWTISFALHKEFRGRGLGKNLISEGIQRLHYKIPSPKKIQAIVKRFNQPSLACFRALGFHPISEVNNKDYVIFETSL